MAEVTKSGDRFIVSVDGKEAGTIEFNWLGDDKIDIIHTEVDSEYSGQGLGKQLVEAVAQFADKNSHKLQASCPYAKKTLQRMPEYEHLLQ
ncbi:N-acetyltransferase [Chryseobacterium salipaludis]|uniref:GNAT family N-acetyltransferase n=1 Tax=Chryseobacterium TaxID=59732 RepID=UPI001FF36B23|nr:MULTISPECIES: GNAT family N-acetyltransferase [Chryseobacterium]MCJ8497054.1 N-acetyltransferase [Chryseobacterium salipaludis]MCX3296535.1 GNAT family N-acetyltransferase [Planobacterium sp. JC490]